MRSDSSVHASISQPLPAKDGAVPKHSGAVLFTKIYAVPVFCQAQSRRRWEAIGQVGVSLDGGRLPCLKHCAEVQDHSGSTGTFGERNKGEVGLCDSGEVT